MNQKFERLKAVVFDWAGTTVDHGSRAPAIVFQEVFRQRGVDITAAQAREPMGMAKRDHIAAIAAMPDVARAWVAQFGRPCGEEDIDAMYDEFLPLQKETLKSHCDVIAGVAEAVQWCRDRGLKIGSSTGYTRELMEVVTEAAGRQGYAPDCVLCAEDAPRGRPAPYLLYEAAKRLDVYPMWSMVKVDDTPVGIEAGRNAGCWTIGVTRTGNGVGLSLEEINAMPSEDASRLCEQAAHRLTAAGAHYTIESVSDAPQVIDEIEQRAARGELPIECEKPSSKFVPPAKTAVRAARGGLAFQSNDLSYYAFDEERLDGEYDEKLMQSLPSGLAFGDALLTSFADHDGMRMLAGAPFASWLYARLCALGFDAVQPDADQGGFTVQLLGMAGDAVVCVVYLYADSRGVQASTVADTRERAGEVRSATLQWLLESITTVGICELEVGAAELGNFTNYYGWNGNYFLGESNVFE